MDDPQCLTPAPGTAGRQDRPLATFALFAYNQEQFIREAVEGAFAQTYEPLEIILSDDCSTDRTFEIMQEMAAAYRGPHTIVVHRTERNLGKEMFGLRVWSLLSQARGDFIVLAAGDDRSCEHRCSKLTETWINEGRPTASIHSLAQPVDECGGALGTPVGNNDISSISLRRLVSKDGRGILGATQGISRNLVTSFDPFPSNIAIEDGALAFRARLLGRVLFVPEVLVMYRRHANNLTAPGVPTHPEVVRRIMRGLRGQQTAFLGDYLRARDDIDRKIVLSIFRRISHIERVRYLYSKNPISKFVGCMTLYSHLPIILRTKISVNFAIRNFLKMQQIS